MADTLHLAPDARDALNRLVASPGIARAPRIQTVLKFIVGELIDGRADLVNEQRIGERAFGRPASFSPAEDNIVRVTVGHLRTRLEEYYRDEGVHETWILEIPKGRYVPAIRQRETPPPPAPEPAVVPFPAPAAASPPNDPPPPTPPANAAQQLRSRLLVPALALGLILTSSALVYLLFFRSTVPQHSALGLLPQIFHGRNLPLTVVLSDETLLAYRYIFGRTVPLRSYLDFGYLSASPSPTPLEAKALAYVRLRQSTNTGSTTAALALHSALQPFGVKVRHPSELSMPEFQNDSIILLGGPWVNPWVQLLEDKLVFRTYAPPTESLSEIHNAQPQPGEREVYAAHSEKGVEVSYVRVAVQPNLSGRGHVVLIGGIRGPSQEAGCNLLLDPSRTAEILKRIGAPDVAHLPPFELLLEVRGVSHTPLDVHIVAHRTR